MSYIPAFLNGSGGGVQLALAAAMESRVHTVSKYLIPRAQFAADTAVTLTNGSFNIRATTNENIPTSATACLANSTNAVDSGDPDNVLGQPLIVKVKKDEFTSEITAYGVFNADGSFPGAPKDDPQNSNWDPWSVTAARYRIDLKTGNIYLNKTNGLVSLVNEDGTINVAGARTGAVDGIVGIVEFDNLQGGALYTAQQEAADLSGIIQSLTSVIRSINDSKRSVLNIIR